MFMLLSAQKLELRVRAKRLKKLWRICTEATELYLEEFPVPHITRRLITTFEVACAQATES